MTNTLKLAVAGLHDEGRASALKRSLGLVANIQSVAIDAERGEVTISGDPDEHLVVVHLTNEGFEVHPIHEAPQHPSP